MNVRPTQPGAVIRDPHTRRPLPKNGGRVPDTTFWRRRLRAGEVELVPEKPTVTAPQKPSPPRSK